MILLIAYGNCAYARFASNLAYSIKKFIDVHITLASDGCHKGYDMSKIDNIIPFNPDDYNNDPCLVKIKLPEISPYEKTIFLDVDMLCLKNPKTLFDNIIKQSFWIDCIRQTNENWWMRSGKMAKYGCQTIFNDVNSSIMAFDKSKETTDYFNRLHALYCELDKRDLKNCWGKKRLIPDEVLHSCTLSNPIESTAAVHYCDNDGLDMSTYFLSMYGFGIAKPISKSVYDNVMKSCNENYYPIASLYKNKFVGR